MSLQVALWIAAGIAGFAAALAWQMRLMIGVVLARALRARDPGLDVRASRLSVVRAGNGEAGSATGDAGERAIRHVQDTYPDQVRHLRLARRASLVAPALIVLCLAAIRFPA